MSQTLAKDLAQASAGELSAALAARRVSAIELTEAAIGRIEALDGPINAGGLPIGVQIIGPYLEDRTTIGFAGLIVQAFGGFRPPGSQAPSTWAAIPPRVARDPA